ncbi:DUF7296 family protein [Streptomyces sparsogenes]|uniref:DUF7296 family protein n=1 Tax=Streptomyces sparsogenes TaxID=67365 RepID=UPI0033FF6AD2
MFFTFTQNNSYGAFDFDEARGITEYVIVEADTADEANERAEGIGLYFDGVGDCPCCGDRWYAQRRDEDGDSTPSIYDEPVETATSYFKWMGDSPDVFVHYADGRNVAHHLQDNHS